MAGISGEGLVTDLSPVRKSHTGTTVALVMVKAVLFLEDNAP